MELYLVFGAALCMVSVVSFLIAFPNLKIGEFAIPEQVRVFTMTVSSVSGLCGVLAIAFCSETASPVATTTVLVMLFFLALGCCILALPHFTFFKTTDERIGAMITGVMVFIFAASFALGSSWKEETPVTATGASMEIDMPYKQVCIDGALWYIFGEENPVQVFEKNRNGMGIVPKACR